MSQESSTTRPPSEDDLNSRLTALDKGFEAQSLPHKYRSMQAFKDIYGKVPDGLVRTNLFDRIGQWFIRRYGQRAQWDAIIGRIPVLWRSNLYLILVPFALGDAAIPLAQQVEGLPGELAAEFDAELFGTTGRQVAAVSVSFGALYNLVVDDDFLDVIQRALVWRGIFDLENCAHSLRHVGDAQNAIFHAHAATEKFLKVALIRAGSNANLKSLGHRLPEIFDKLVALDGRYSWLKAPVDNLHAVAPDMNIRYSMVPRTVQDAITAFNGSVNVCGSLARTWLFDIQRGTSDSSFAEGKVYLDGTGAVCFCMRLIKGEEQEDSALILRMIDLPNTGRTIVVEMTVPSSVSGLYLQVRDERQADQMRSKLKFHMQPRNRVLPADMGIQITSGAEGSYTTALFRVPIRPQAAARKSKPGK